MRSANGTSPEIHPEGKQEHMPGHHTRSEGGGSPIQAVYPDTETTPLRVRLLRAAFQRLLALLTRSQAAALEKVPPRGPYLLVANHMSMVDAALGYAVFGCEHAAAWVAEKWENHPFFGLILRAGGGIFIQRGEVDRSALQAAADWLQQGNIFAIAPEGTRSHDGQLQRAKTGSAYVAHLAQAPILPVGLIGTDRAFDELLHLRKPQLTLRVGDLFHLPPVDPEDRAGSLRRNTDEIMCRIAALLPERYWGYYRDHPRLQELLRSTGT